MILIVLELVRSGAANDSMKWALHLYHQQRQGIGHGWSNLLLPLFIRFG
jgi:hypothetical protein